MEIKKGDRFKCIKNVYMNGDLNDIAYYAGRLYKSDADCRITDENGLIDHYWKESNPEKFFIPYVSNKRKGYGRKKV